MTTFPVLLDTNCLFGAYLCDVLLTLAEAGIYRPLWSAGILDELQRNLVRKGLEAAKADHRIASMRTAFPDAEVRGYERHIGSMTCDPKDRHVLAAAVVGAAQVLVTQNLNDFPAESCEPYDIVVVSPDDFLLDQLDLYPGVVMGALRARVADYANPPMEVEELLGRLAASGATRFAAEAARHLQSTD